MFLSLFGLLGGIGMPMQTGINAQLGKRVGSPFLSALINFAVGLGGLLLITLIWERGLHYPLEDVLAAPPWVVMGGMIAAFFVTGNILLMPRLGAVQLSILTALGQILMAALVDSFGWFHGVRREPDPLRLLGLLLVFGGVVLVVGSKRRSTPEKAAESAPLSHLWLWRLLGLLVGMGMATQTAINSHLGVVVDSRLLAGTTNFFVGMCTLLLVNLLLLRTKGAGEKEGPMPLWVLSGGFFGDVFVIGNIIAAQTLGTGMAVVILLTGLMIGGLLVDGFGLFRSEQRPVGWKEAAGVAVMIAGALLFYLG